MHSQVSRRQFVLQFRCFVPFLFLPSLTTLTTLIPRISPLEFNTGLIIITFLFHSHAPLMHHFPFRKLLIISGHPTHHPPSQTISPTSPLPHPPFTICTLLYKVCFFRLSLAPLWCVLSQRLYTERFNNVTSSNNSSWLRRKLLGQVGQSPTPSPSPSPHPSPPPHPSPLPHPPLGPQ